MNNFLALPTVELTTTLTTVPKNGAPSSNDFNSFQQQVLADLAEITTLLNEQILPVLNALPSAAAEGLDGSGLYAGRNIDTSVFHDANGNLYLVSDVISTLYNSQQALAAATDNVSAQVLALQTRLATTNQSSLQASMQNLQTIVAAVQSSLSSMAASLSSATIAASNQRGTSIPLTTLAVGTTPITVTLNPAYADNNYTAMVSVESADGAISLQNFHKQAGGVGLIVNVLADSTSPSGTLHIFTRAL